MLGFRLPDQRKPRKPGETLTVAVIYPDMPSSYYSRLLVAIEEKISRYNGFVISACSRFDVLNEAHLAQSFSNMPNISGLIIITGSRDLTEPLSRIGTALPVVVISHGDVDNKVDLIKVNDQGGVDEAIGYFAKQGHKEIGYIGEPLTHLRLSYFMEAMSKRGLPVQDKFIRISNSRFEDAGYSEMSKMLKQGDCPTAIYAAYDNIALGAMRAIYEAGLKIPQDISIIGEDAIETAGYLQDRLSTIDCHIEEQGNIACSILYKKIMDRDFTAVQSVAVATELVLRDTVAAPSR